MISCPQLQVPNHEHAAANAEPQTFDEVLWMSMLQDIRSRDLLVARAKIAEQEADEKLKSGLVELEAIEKLTKRQLAVMRWQHAACFIQSGMQASLFRLPIVTQAPSQHILHQVLAWLQELTGHTADFESYI